MKTPALNPLLVDRSRLLIMATLAAASEPIEFMTLMNSLDMTRGNLSTHMRKLEEAGWITVSKEFVERKPLTTYRCTGIGRSEVKRYLSEVERVLKKL